MSYSILDNWKVSGTDPYDLDDVIRELDTKTRALTCRSEEIEIYTVYRIDDDSVHGYIHSHGTLKALSVDRAELDDEMMEELGRNLYLLRIGGEWYYVSANTMSTLSQRGGMSLGETARRDEFPLRFHRDAFINNFMNIVPTDCRVVYRQEGSIKKVLAVMTDRQKEIPQKTILEAVEALETDYGDARIDRWEVGQFLTSVTVSFPEKQGDFTRVVQKSTGKYVTLSRPIIPGIEVSTDDCGNSSFRVNGFLNIDGVLVYPKDTAYKRAHTKGVKVTDILDNVQNRIFPEFSKLPERLCELLLIDVYNPQAVIEDIIDVLKIGELGKKVKEQVESDLVSSLNPGIFYTAYDIVMMFIDKGAELEGTVRKDLVDVLRGRFVQSAFYPFA